MALLPAKNDKGEFALYEKGALIGYGAVTLFDGVRVLQKYVPILKAMKEAAKKDGVDLVLVSGLRTMDEQIAVRVKHVIDKAKANDPVFIMTAEVNFFNPWTGKPGHSNHQSGVAFDYAVTGKPTVYAWLVRNAYKYGFVRTVPSERWHWEYRPDVINPFYKVFPTDATWDGMAWELTKLAAEVNASRLKKAVQENPGKTAAIILLPAAAVGLFFLVRYLINRNQENDQQPIKQAA